MCLWFMSVATDRIVSPVTAVGKSYDLQTEGCSLESYIGNIRSSIAYLQVYLL